MVIRKRKILIRALLVIFVGIPLLVFFLMQTVFFQTFIFSKVIKNYTSKMGGKVIFEEIYFSPLSGLNIKSLYIEDDKKDTLLFAEYFRIELSSVDFSKPEVKLNALSLENAFYNLYSINDREQTNMQHIINYFSSSVSEDTLKSVFKLEVNNINISNLKFKYKRLQPDSVEYGVNFYDLDLTRFDLEAENFRLINDSMNVDLKKMLINESSGFKLQNLTGHAVISSTEISVSDLILKTPQSNIFANRYSMNYGKWVELGDFVDVVKLDLDMQLSSVNLLDIAYFTPVFENIEVPTFAKGRIYGTISSLKGKNLTVSLGDKSRLNTRFSIQGLPNVNETFLSLDVEKLALDINDVETVFKNQSGNVQDDLPEIIRRLENINYNGNITGFLTDLVAYGTFKNKHGILNSDVRFKYNSLDESYLYSGKVETSGLDLSVLNLTDTIYGNLTMNGQILVEIDSVENIKGQLEGQIESIGINKYDYQNITLNADLEKLKLQSELTINDTNLFVNVQSQIDFSLDEPYFDFQAEVKDAFLSKLNWIDRDTSSEISFDIDAQFSSLKIDQFFGEFTINNLSYKEGKETVLADEINLRSIKNGNKRLIDINSDLFSAKFEGDYLIEHLIQHADELRTSYLPAFFPEAQNKNTPHQNLVYDIHLKNTMSAFKIFTPDFMLADGSNLKGYYDSKEEKVELDFNSEFCSVYEDYAEQVNLLINGDLKELNSDFNSDYISVSEDIFFNDVHLKNKLRSDSLNFYLNWMNSRGQEMDGAELMAEIIFNPSDVDSLSANINMIPSYFIIEDSVWYVNDAEIKLRGLQTVVDELVINHDNQYLFADGIWQKGQSDSLHLILNHVDLSYFPILEQKTTLKMRGLIDGDILLSYNKDQPLASGFLKIDTFKINDRLLGNTEISMDWEPKEERLLLEFENEVGSKKFKTIKSQGYIDVRSSHLNLDVNLDKQKLAFFEPFIEDYLSDIEGYVSGDLNITGPFKNLEYKGGLDFTRAALTYDYLGTRYNFSDNVKITKRQFVFDNIKFFQVDGKGDYAVANGYIEHDNFTNFEFYINIEANDFMVLNTKASDNELYYGTAFLTGFTQITGTYENLKIDISGETNKNTRFYIPLSDTEEASSAGFISFESKKRASILSEPEEDYKLDLSGIILDFNLNVTPEAEVQIIFDDKMGDIVKAKGSGALNLKINTLGNFTMSGSYTIDKGEYLFTLQNVINKKFKIEPGSDIKWNGDPYQAYVNIDAVYRLKTPIYDLTLNAEDKERIPVECHLNMEKSLMSPEISFDIKLPSSGDRAKNLINAMDQDEKNKQLLSLLVLNKFYTPDYLIGGEAVGSGNAVGKNASELLSNQLSNWLSQISDDFDIGVNYRPGDDISNDELELALSTQLFNDRVAIDGNLGVGKYENTNSNVVGNVNVDVKINKKGNVRIRGFNRVNENEIENSSLYTQGVGLYYREDFDTFGELLNKYWKKVTFQNSNDTIK